MLSDLPEELLLDITSYFKPNYERLFEIWFLFEDECWDNQKLILNDCKNYLKLASLVSQVNWRLNSFVKSWLFSDTVYFSGDIDVGIISKYKPSIIIAPNDNKLIDDNLKYNQQITHLFLEQNTTITNAGLAHCSFITHLRLGCNTNITDVGLSHIPLITHLDFWCETNITDAGLAHISRVTHLRLGYNIKITDAGLAQCPFIAHLKLWCNTNITDAGLVQLSLLTHLHFWFNTNITDAGLARCPILKECWIRDQKRVINARVQLG